MSGYSGERGMHGQYHKIPTIWWRDPKTHKLVVGKFSRPEFELLNKLEWEWTEKVDGTNIRVGWDGQEVKFGGKTDRAQLQVELFDRLKEIFSTEEQAQIFEQTFEDATIDSPVTLYGEGYGARIQKGGGNYNPDGTDFVLFDIRIGGSWLERKNVEDIGAKLGLDVVPIVGTGSLESASARAKIGFESRWGEDVTPEGLVMRPAAGLLNRRGQRIIGKIKHKDFA